MFNKTLFVILLVLSMIPVASHALVYDLVDYSNADHTLSGTITTDGTLGLLGVENVTGWNVTVSGLHNFTFSSTDPTAEATFLTGPAPNVTASQSDIVITGGGFFALVLNPEDVVVPQYSYRSGWAFVNEPGNASPIYSLPVGDSGQYVYATASPIPVPAAVWLFGTALVGLVGFSKRRKAA